MQIKIQMMKTSDLVVYDNNPRFNEGAVEYVAASIKEFGFKVPIIVAGHTRLKEIVSSSNVYKYGYNKRGQLVGFKYDKQQYFYGDTYSET